MQTALPSHATNVNEELTESGESILLYENKPTAALVIVFGRTSEVVLLSPSAPVTVGRAPRSAPYVRVDDPKLSREHVRFSLAEDEQTVHAEDLGSRNGTFRLGERIQSCTLHPGDELTSGRTRVRFERIGVPSSPLFPVRKPSPPPRGTVVASKVMRELYDTAKRIASSRIAVLILGETGTGKELFARYIHENSPRHNQPLVTINCGAIPSQLVESTLFGHEKGSFTGAVSAQKGVFEAAEGGTVFLDEVGELPASVQAALLRVLETGRFQRIGSSREQQADVRLITATHRDLEAMGTRGEFRPDLYYRLSGVVLELPPLRERKDEIEPLAKHFLSTECALHGRSLRGFEPEALKRLMQYSFPGNVRELRNIIARAVVLAQGDFIRLSDLPKTLQSFESAGQRGTPATAKAPAAGSHDPSSTIPEQPKEFRDQVQRYEADAIRQALVQANWRRSEAALALGMPLRTLAYKIKSLGIKKDEGE